LARFPGGEKKREMPPALIAFGRPFGVECGSALLCRFGFSCLSFLSAFRSPALQQKKQSEQKPKRQSKALPHSRPDSPRPASSIRTSGKTGHALPSGPTASL